MSEPLTDERLAEIRHDYWNLRGAPYWVHVRDLLVEVDRLRGIVATLDARLLAAAERVVWERTHAPLPDGWRVVVGLDAVWIDNGSDPILVVHNPSSPLQWRANNGRCRWDADTLAELIEQVTR